MAPPNFESTELRSTADLRVSAELRVNTKLRPTSTAENQLLRPALVAGEEVHHVKPILEAYYELKSVSGIAQLQEKALIRIDKHGWEGCRIWMHDLIEEMGKDIVYQESPDEPGERNRVWSEEDADHVLANNTGTNKVIGIQIYFYEGNDEIYESFSGDIDYLSNQLRWLDWPECSLQCFPSDFHAKKLVNLDISESRGITRLWEGPKLRGCESLTELPDLSGIPNLKELDLYGCTSLVSIPDSIRFLHNLVNLYVHDCSNLIMFPRKINLRSVETISVCYCKLEEFSEVREEMYFLRKLDLIGTCIKELHLSITKRIWLEQLGLEDSQNLTTLPYNIYELHYL
ncbi:probable WRKY transcription factor 19 [Rosa rugosa]|uniref:probable WRKY transcription factor 19 n=1 Tax=Rosa rugosa TaxID=74645 RepID=UPI002B40F51F|nr:probable WRKY transcription factor 19 [Rosa rugosa]